MTAIEKANDFRLHFIPTNGVDYGWVLTRAKEQFAHVEAAMEQVDGKAAVVINYFGSGAGILAFVATAGVSTNPAFVWTALFALPAFVLAAVSIVFAVYARAPQSMNPPPDASNCAGYLKHYVDKLTEAKKTGGALGETVKSAEYATAGLWHYLYAENCSTLNEKAVHLESAIRYKVYSIIALLLPLLEVIAEKLIAKF